MLFVNRQSKIKKTTCFIILFNTESILKIETFIVTITKQIKIVYKLTYINSLRITCHFESLSSTGTVQEFAVTISTIDAFNIQAISIVLSLNSTHDILSAIIVIFFFICLPKQLSHVAFHVTMVGKWHAPLCKWDTQLR